MGVLFLNKVDQKSAALLKVYYVTSNAVQKICLDLIIQYLQKLIYTPRKFLLCFTVFAL